MIGRFCDSKFFFDLELVDVLKYKKKKNEKIMFMLRVKYLFKSFVY